MTNSSCPALFDQKKKKEILFLADHHNIGNFPSTKTQVYQLFPEYILHPVKATNYIYIIYNINSFFKNIIKFYESY
jgi:hypothetical protein